MHLYPAAEVPALSYCVLIFFLPHTCFCLLSCYLIGSWTSPPLIYGKCKTVLRLSICTFVFLLVLFRESRNSVTIDLHLKVVLFLLVNKNQYHKVPQMHFCPNGLCVLMWVWRGTTWTSRSAVPSTLTHVHWVYMSVNTPFFRQIKIPYSFKSNLKSSGKRFSNMLVKVKSHKMHKNSMNIV